MSTNLSLELHEQQHSEPYYTKAQVMELLSISENQVYEYVKKKKIRPLPNPYKMRKESVYYREEVDQLAEKRKALTTTYSVSDAAKRFGVSRQRIDYFIRANSLEIEYLQLDKAKRIRLPESTMAAIEQILENEKHNSPKYRKSTYFNEKANIALYQLFIDEEGNEYRAVVVGKQWGLLLPEDGTFIQYEDAIKSINLKKAYDINQPVLNESNYTVLMLPKNEQITWTIYDYFLSVLGIHNISIRDHEQQIELQVKQGIIELTKHPLPTGIYSEQLEKFVSAGEVIVTEHELFLAGKSHFLRTTISLESYKSLCAEADSEGKSLGELLDKILSERYKGKL